MAKGILKFKVDKCKGCGLCIKYCPKQVLALDATVINALGYHPVGIAKEGCIGCGTCGLMCPDGVINVYQE
ncbi:MAG: 4Fe-4S binding protein [Firmicutes bacterium]|nr:4Fe-4S binding protein [Bacillota bacterium]